MIKIYIISSYSDMEEEHNKIHSLIFKFLKRSIATLGQEILLYDLKYNMSSKLLNTDDASKDILLHLKNFTFDSNSYFVLLLGEKYGYIPCNELVNNYLKGNFKSDLSTLMDKSLVEIETRYIINKLGNNLFKRFFVFNRDDKVINDICSDQKDLYVDNNDNLSKLSDFKKYLFDELNLEPNRYMSKWDDSVSKVMPLDSFSSSLLVTLLNNIKSNLDSNPLNFYKQAELYEKSIMNNHISFGVDCDLFVKEVHNFYVNNDDVLILENKESHINSITISYVTKELLKYDDLKVITLMLENTFYYPNTKNILLNIINRILSEKSIPELNDVTFDIPTDINDLKVLASKLINVMLKHKRVIILIDNVDMIEYHELNNLLLNIPLPRENNRFKLVLTLKNSNALNLNQLILHNYKVIDCESLLSFQPNKLVGKYLQKYNLDLFDETINNIYKACDKATPLYINLFMNRLTNLTPNILHNNDFIMMDILSNKLSHSSYLSDLIKELPSYENEIIINLINHYAEAFGESDYYKLLRLISLSNQSFRFNDLYCLMKEINNSYSLLDVYNMICYSKGILYINEFNGTVSFTHPNVKVVYDIMFENMYYQIDVLLFDYTNLIFNYLDNEPTNSSIYLRLYPLFALESKNINKFCVAYLYLRDEKFNYEEFNFILRDKNRFNDLIELLKLSSYDVLENNVCGPFVLRAWLNDLPYSFIDNSILNVLKESDIHYETYKSRYSTIIEFYKKIYNSYKNIKKDVTTCKLLEKCGDLELNNHTKIKYYKEYLKLCFEVLKGISKNEKDYLTLSYDYVNVLYKYSKASSEYTKDLKYIINIYDHAINYIDKFLNNINNEDFQVKDKFLLKKYCFIIYKYQFIIDNMNYDLFDEYLLSLSDDLRSATKYFSTSIVNFTNNNDFDKVYEYRNYLIDSYIVLSKSDYYCDPEVENYYLLKALKESEELLTITNDIYVYDKIKKIKYLIGNCENNDFDIRFNYYGDAYFIATRLFNANLDNKFNVNNINLIDSIHKNEICLTLNMIHSNSDFEISLSSIHNIYNRDEYMVKIDDDNYSSILDYLLTLFCRLYNDAKTRIINKVTAHKKVHMNALSAMVVTMNNFISYRKLYIDKSFEKFMQTKDSHQALDRKALVNELKSIFEKVLDQNRDFLIVIRYFVQLMSYVYFEDINDIYTNILDIYNKLTRMCSYLYFNCVDYLFNDKPVYDTYIHLKAEYSLYKYMNNNYSYNHNRSITFTIIEDDIKALYDLYLFETRIFMFDFNIDEFSKDVTWKNPKHWYNTYQRFSKIDNYLIQDSFEVVGGYLCNNFDKLSVQKLIYHSIFYESIALEYAYRNLGPLDARKIFNNGFDHYLEIGTLYIIKKYDEKYFYNVFSDLKVVCLKRGIRAATRYLKDTYGEDFCSEYIKMANNALNAIDYSNKNNPLLSKYRSMAEWAWDF